ncbi:MAG: SAM-dependent methyltransferase [Alphaproteobacteria bacterium]|nr:SAM-dependent methyltransferase [Alphaproteobacteria bacterium]
MQSLKKIILSHIKTHGPMSVETYWTLCLSHPEHGYYIKQDPLGSAGDFTTSPEISQLFGEMIGIWAAEQWNRLGKPDTLHLIECGPGRGTLMADLLRIAKLIPDFAASLYIHLVETSPKLRNKQKQVLEGWNVIWHDNISTIPTAFPNLIVGNEFLDALPIRQFVFDKDGWFERVIGASNDALTFGRGGQVSGTDFPASTKENIQGQIFEYSPAREACFAEMCEKVSAQGGAILMIDYGHTKSALGDTFQAVKSHKFVDVLENAGDADLTSHVDFERLMHKALDYKLAASCLNQSEFLMSCGIEQRARQLKEKAMQDQRRDIDLALQRLTADDQMGTLFKVLEVQK